MKYKLLLIAILVLTVPMVQAQEDFFTGAYDPEPSICSCQTITDTIMIRNTAGEAQSYSISTGNDKAQAPGSITLPAGEQTDIDVQINVPCDREPVIQEYNLYIENNRGEEQVIKRDLRINKCQSINASLQADTDNVNPCRPVNYDLNLTNPAPFSEEYTVKPNNYEEYFENNKTNLTLNPQESEIVENQLNLSCELYGDKNVEFLVKSHNNDLEEIYTHNLTVNRAYEYEIYTEDTNICKEEGGNIPVEITNIAEYDNNYTLRLEDNPEFVALEEETLAVESGSQNTTIINVEENFEPGEHTFKLITESELGEIEQRENITLNYEECYDFDVEIRAEKQYCSGDKLIDVEIQNKGLYLEDITLDIDTELETEYEKEHILEPNENISIPVILTIPDKDEEYSLKASLNLQNKTWEDEIIIEGYSQRSCKEVIITDQKPRTRYYHEGFELLAQNKGIKDSEYTLEDTTPEGIELLNTSITIPKHRSEEIRYTTNLSEEDIGVEEFNLTLIADNGQVYEYEVELRILDEPVPVRLYNWIGDNSCGIATFLLIVLLVTSIVLISCRIRDKGERKLDWTRTIALILIPLILITTIFLYGAPQLSSGFNYEDYCPFINSIIATIILLIYILTPLKNSK